MRVSIIGLGLIGGSLGLALSSAGHEVAGYARKPRVAALALEMGAVDRAAKSLTSAVKKADVVIIAAPVLAVKDILSAISNDVPAGAIVTDVASTKAAVMGWAEECLSSRVNFIGGHPMAGKEVAGIESADAKLFQGCTYCLVPGAHASKKSQKTLEGLVRSVGAKPLYIDAAEHDRLVAGISHLPLLLSTALVADTTGSPLWPSMSRLASSGYRDTSRLASGDPRMSRDICLTNKEPILTAIDEYIKELKKLRRLVGSGDEGLEDYFIRAKEARDNWLRRK
jgi:prephenate dehydrogenase